MDQPGFDETDVPVFVSFLLLHVGVTAAPRPEQRHRDAEVGVEHPEQPLVEPVREDFLDEFITPVTGTQSVAMSQVETFIPELPELRFPVKLNMEFFG